MKSFLISLVLMLMLGCGGGENNSETVISDCSAEEHNVYLADGESCMLTQSLLADYSVDIDRAGPGFIACDDGDFDLNGSTYPSGTIFGQTFYGLTINCEFSAE